MSRSLLLVVAVLLALPASAQAAFDVPAFSVTPSGLAAGSHPDVSVALQFGGDEHVRGVTLSLPPGLVGNPNATARCGASAFAADDCPAAARIGTTSVVSRIALLSVLPVTADGDVYNLQPGAGEPARLGVVVRPPLGADKVFIVARVALRPSDGGLDSIITGLPATIGTPLGDLDMRIESMTLTLLGRPAGAKLPFMTMPTSCRTATARVLARSDDGTAVSRSAPPFTPTACGRLRFAPALAASVTHDIKPAVRTVITGPAGNANTAAAAVTLPKGLAVNTAMLQSTCTLAQQEAGPCPAAARIGRAVAASPLLPPLTGPVYLAQVPGRVLPGVRVDLSGVVDLSLTGSVDGNPLRTEFGGLPDVPLSRFELTFDAGRGLLATKDFCRGRLPRIGAELTGHNGARATLREPMTVTGCAQPVATLRVHGRRLRLRVKAARGGPALARVRLTLPKRLKVHPRRGHVTRGAKLTRRALKIPAGGARTVRATLSRGAFTGRLGKKRRLVLRTRDVTGHIERQRIRARR
ncbi:MAG TPA: hypothetical protein VFM58_24415 [Solirubrobacteraceae bacterium]|nr:hypothetical protein [Solirubrobacteraceae bacterium]